MKGATSIQERLWELRKDKGLNLEELSELTGISKSALGSYEKRIIRKSIMATLSRWQTSMEFPLIICCAGQRTERRSIRH